MQENYYKTQSYFYFNLFNYNELYGSNFISPSRQLKFKEKLSTQANSRPTHRQNTKFLLHNRSGISK
ncbi:hypothetical protein CYANOKiyG1_59800 [Okeania sp. KiyG1]|nr:hypothetical protein CYANOKiyG1_59800 [Okeania sp. KiyG1]